MPSARGRSRCAARSSGTRACSSAPGTTSARSSGELQRCEKIDGLWWPSRREMLAVRATDQGGGGVRSRARRGKRLVRRAWPGGHIKQPGQSALRSREGIAGRIECEIPAFGLLDVREVALARGLRERLVGRFPERRAQSGSGFHVGFHHALEGSPRKAAQQTMNSHLSHKKNSSFVDRKSTRLNSSHVSISYAVFCLKKKKI